MSEDQKSEQPKTSEEIRQVIEEIVADPFFTMNSDEERDTLRLLVASCHLGTNADKLAKFLGLNRDKFVRPRAKRLRENGVWEDGQVCLDGETPEEVSLALVLAVLCAEGFIKRQVHLDEPGYVKET